MSTEDSPPPAVVISAVPDLRAPEAVEFYRWLGICISSWAFVDRRLYQIFHHATGFEVHQSALVYYGNRQFNARLRMTDKAAKMFLPQDIFEGEWRPLNKETLNLAHTRNIVAHQPAKRLATSKDGMAFDIYSIHIEPYERILNDDYPGLRGKTELLVEDLKNHDTEVSHLESKLHNFAWRIGGVRAARKSGV
jgi:hypothetical protein